jgi:RimJ/RimL family protein N-acetyltransferase
MMTEQAHAVSLAEAGVRAERVETFDQAETLRRVRNICREYMTNNQRLISPGDQVVWWTLNQSRVKAWLYCDNRTDRLLGFGLLRPYESDMWWVTLGLVPKQRGRGYGRLIYRHLAEEADGPVMAEILEDNLASIAAATHAGYELLMNGQRTRVYWRVP